MTMHRTFWLALVVLLVGCKTVEVEVAYPLANVHVVAKFEARDKPARDRADRIADAEAAGAEAADDAVVRR